MKKANPTDAKTVALYFLDITQTRYTPAIIAKTINQTKNLMKSGYTAEEIIEVIDYIDKHTDVQMYSIGYINSSINDVLRKVNVEKEKEKLRLKIEQSKTDYLNSEVEEEVVEEDESTERNREKARRISIQSRKREESYLDLLEE